MSSVNETTFFCPKCSTFKSYSRKYEFLSHVRKCEGTCYSYNDRDDDYNSDKDNNPYMNVDDCDSFNIEEDKIALHHSNIRCDIEIDNVALSSHNVKLSNTRDEISLQDLYVNDTDSEESNNSFHNIGGTQSNINTKVSSEDIYNQSLYETFQTNNLSSIINYPSDGSSTDISNISTEEDDSSLGSNISYTLNSDFHYPNDMKLSELEISSLHFFTKNAIPIKYFNEFCNIINNTEYSSSLKNKTDIRSSKMSSYVTMMRKLRSIECMQRHQYNIKLFSVKDYTFRIRVFPFLHNIKWLLNNQLLMEDAYFRYNSSSQVYSEFNTGTWWKEAEENMLERVRKSGWCTERHVLIPIILFIDKTHCSTNGSLSAEPILGTIGNISMRNRTSNVDAWFNIGFLPQKILSQAEIENNRKGKGCRCNHVEIYHSALSILLSELKFYQQKDYSDDAGIDVFIHGLGNVHAHFELAMVIGDCVGNDQICCHYQGYSSKVSRPMRMCYCSFEDLDNPDVICYDVNAKILDSIIGTCIEHVKKKMDM